MLKQLIFIGLSLFLSVAAFGQEKITIKEEKLSDVSPFTYFRTNKQIVYSYKVGEADFQGIGYKGESIEAILKTDEAAYKEFKKFKRNLALGKASYWIGSGVAVGLLVVSTISNVNPQNARGTTAGAAIALFGGYLTTFLSFKNAPKHLHNAVMIYNLNLEKK